MNSNSNVHPRPRRFGLLAALAAGLGAFTLASAAAPRLRGPFDIGRPVATGGQRRARPGWGNRHVQRQARKAKNRARFRALSKGR